MLPSPRKLEMADEPSFLIPAKRLLTTVMLLSWIVYRIARATRYLTFFALLLVVACCSRRFASSSARILLYHIRAPALKWSAL